MDKKVLREKYKKIREEIVSKLDKSYKISSKLYENEHFKSSSILGIYVSNNSEVNTEDIIINSLRLGKIVAVPKVINKDKMNFYKINSLDDLVTISKFGIREPSDDIKNLVLPSDIDLFIIPGICFDKNKNRIGYGKGFYDKYLIKSPNSYKIGLSFSEQILNNYIESNSADIKLDEIITDKNIIK